MTPLRRHSAPAMGRRPKYKHEIAALRKNSCERLHVSLEEYNGIDLVNLAVKRDSTGQHLIGGMKQTARYVSLQLRQLPELIRALQDAEAKAIAEGLMEAAGESVSARNGLASPATPENHKPASATAETPGTSFKKGNCP